MSAPLRVIYKRSGGLAHFPGLAAGREVAPALLGDEGCAALLGLAAASGPAGGRGAGYPDALCEWVVVEAAGSRRQYRAEDFRSAGLEALWERIREVALQAG